MKKLTLLSLFLSATVALSAQSDLCKSLQDSYNKTKSEQVLATAKKNGCDWAKNLSTPKNQPATTKPATTSQKSLKQIQCEQRWKDGKEAYDKGDYDFAKKMFQKALDEGCTNAEYARYIALCEDAVLPDAERLRIRDVKFANGNFARNIIDNYGSILYDTTSYLSPKIYYDNLATSSKKITLFVKIIAPDGTLKKGYTSPSGYTYSDNLLLEGQNISSNQKLSGWGNTEKTYWSTGTYTFEIWCSDKKLYTAKFEIKASKVILSVSPTEIEFDASGGSKSIFITSNISSWSVSAVKSWLSATKYSTGITLSCAANSETSERTDYFYVTSGSKQVKVTIKQKGKTSSLNLTEVRRLISLNMNQNPTRTYDNGKYKGQTNSDNKRSGLGIYYWNDGEFYFGDWSSGVRDGYGIHIMNEGYVIANCPNCTFFVGKSSNGKISGRGTCYDKTGKLIYYGDFLDDKPTGTYPSAGNDSYRFEVIKYTNGNYYIGETKDGKRHGVGILLWSDGGMWCGEWHEGARDGYGIYIWLSGSKKVGTWKGDTYTAN